MTELFNSTAISSAEVASAPEASKKRGWLPLLTVLFLISYALMTMLIIEQGSTIESQRALIHELFRDSSELSKMKGQDRPVPAAPLQSPATKTQNSQTAVNRTPSTQTPLTQIPSVQTPSTHVPLTQYPSTQADQTPSSQAAQQNSAKKSGQKPFRMPSKREPELIDDSRALITI